MRLKSVLHFLCFSLLSSSIFAASITGVVRDSQTNEVLVGATVGAGGEVTSTDENGRFVLNLKAGSYVVKAGYAGAVVESGSVTVADADVTVNLAINSEMANAETYTIAATGSLVGATGRDTAIPIYGIDRVTAQKQGTPTTLDQMKSLPIGGPVFGDANPFNPDAQFRPGSGTFNIRGLGAQRTLVLLNGRRFSANNRTAPDTNMLPSSVIGRVEVLKDGGATTYGSDAIAGVANFFTRQDLDGLEVSTDYRLVSGSPGDVNASAAFGHVWDGGNFLFSAGYQFRGELLSTSRAWTNQLRTVNPQAYSPFSTPGTWAILGLAPGPTPVGVALDGNCAQMGGEISSIGNTPVCNAIYNPYYNLVNEQHQVQLYGEVNTKIGNDAKFHMDAMYAVTSNPKLTVTPSFPLLTGPTGPGSLFFVPATNPGFAGFMAQRELSSPLPPVNIVGALGAVWTPFGLGGDPTGEAAYGGRRAYNKNEQMRVSGELSGPICLLDMNYRVGATYLIEEQLGSFPDILVGRLQAALNGLGGPNCDPLNGGVARDGDGNGTGNCHSFNPFSNANQTAAVSGVPNTNGFLPAAANDLATVAWLNDYNRELRLRTDFGVFDAVVDGKIPLKLPGGEPTWALGGQFRRTTSYTTVDNPLMNSLANPCPIPGDTTCAVKTGPYVFAGQYTPSFVQQGVYALFGQLDIPTFESWKSQLSLRFEDYTGLTGSTLNPQFRTKWELFKGLALRGSIGTSFRAPTATNVAPGINNTQLAPISAAGGGFKANDIYGNPNLLPEKAFSFNVGSILKFSNFTTTVDYWFYKIENQISLVNPDLVANFVMQPNGQIVNCASPLLDLVTLAGACNNAPPVLPTDPALTTGQNIQRVRSDVINGPSLTTTGLDIDVDYLIENVFGGALNLGGLASVMIDYKQDDFILRGQTLALAYDAVGFTNYDRLPGTIPRWRGQFFVNYNHGWHNLRVTTNYTDGATDNRGPVAVQTGATGLPLNATTACTVANANANTAPNCQVTNFGVTLPGFVSLDVAYQLSLPFDMVLTVSAANLIGMDPPLARLPFGYDPFIGNPLGRTFKFGLTQKF